MEREGLFFFAACLLVFLDCSKTHEVLAVQQERERIEDGESGKNKFIMQAGFPSLKGFQNARRAVLENPLEPTFLVWEALLAPS